MKKPRERELQRKAAQILSDPGRTFETTRGDKIRFLSPGRLNLFAGPDFLNLAIMKNGEVFTGDGEFHRRSSDWFAHGHNGDRKYSGVIVHIVEKCDTKREFGADTVVLDLSREPLERSLKQKRPAIFGVESLLDVEEAARERLEQKTRRAKVLSDRFGARGAFSLALKEYLNSYAAKSRRGIYTESTLARIHSDYNDSFFARFFELLAEQTPLKLEKAFERLRGKNISVEKSHLRFEILVNAVLPCALAVAAEESQDSAFSWYWSARAYAEYGYLKRRFPSAPQEFVWQQQGLIGYIKKNGGVSSGVKDSPANYAFAF